MLNRSSSNFKMLELLPTKANDYFEQLQENAKRRQRGKTPTVHQPSSRNQDEPSINPEQSADAIAWAQFRQKLANITCAPYGDLFSHSVGLGDLAWILELAKPRVTVIPPGLRRGSERKKGVLVSFPRSATPLDQTGNVSSGL